MILLLFVMICIPITFNNLIRACFSNKKCILLIQTGKTQNENDKFLIKNLVLIAFLKIIGIQNQIPIRFSIALKRNKILTFRNANPHTRLSNPLISY